MICKLESANGEYGGNDWIDGDTAQSVDAGWRRMNEKNEADRM